MGVISAKQFLAAFSSEWDLRVNLNRDHLLEAYASNKVWTDYMLSHGGFLYSVMKRLSVLVDRLEYSKEIYTIDAMFVGGEDLYRKDLCYPSKLYTLIEHENGENIEEEMWKLIFWRSPLKVLIFYDWNEDQKGASVSKNWATQKISYLMDMRNKVSTFVEEPKETENLFLFANRDFIGGDVFWRWASNTSLNPSELLRMDV